MIEIEILNFSVSSNPVYLGSQLETNSEMHLLQWKRIFLVTPAINLTGRDQTISFLLVNSVDSVGLTFSHSTQGLSCFYLTI